MATIQLIIISIYFLIIEQELVRNLIEKLFNRILKTGEELTRKYPENNSLLSEVLNLKAFDATKEGLKLITRLIGALELVIFSFLAFHLINKIPVLDTDSLISTSSSFLKFFGAWLAIKTIGNYGQWSGQVFGRACFYNFFLGTIANIIGAIFLSVIWLSLLK